jgi:hypothetical protein
VNHSWPPARSCRRGPTAKAARERTTGRHNQPASIDCLVRRRTDGMSPHRRQPPAGRGSPSAWSGLPPRSVLSTNFRLRSRTQAARAGRLAGGEIPGVERRFSKDTLLAIITLYWVTGTIGSSFRSYYDDDQAPAAAPRRRSRRYHADPRRPRLSPRVRRTQLPRHPAVDRPHPRRPLPHPRRTRPPSRGPPRSSARCAATNPRTRSGAPRSVMLAPASCTPRLSARWS